MKKTTYPILVIITIIATACGGTSNTQQFNSGQNGSPANAELPLASKLVIGSFKLEDTDNAITAEQAAQLIPLWQVYQQLTTSDTAAQEEITALADQIQETMTTDQMNAIDAMNLTPQDIFTVMQEQGIQFGGSGQQGQNRSQQNGNNFIPPGGGNFTPPNGGGRPNGGFGGGGGSGRFNNGQNLSPDQIATVQARRAANGGGGNFRFNNTPAPLIEALVKLLQERAAS